MMRTVARIALASRCSLAACCAVLALGLSGPVAEARPVVRPGLKPSRTLPFQQNRTFRSPPSEASPVNLPEARVAEAALLAYLEGDYSRAEQAFERLAASFPEIAGVRFLRGCSLYNLYVVGGESDDSLLAAARVEMRRTAELAPAFFPDPALFSPRLISFFDTARF